MTTSQIVDGRDARVVEGGHRLCLAVKTRDSLWIAGVRVGQDFDGHPAIQLRVLGEVHLAHTTGAKEAEDLVWPEARPRDKRHAGLP